MKTPTWFLKRNVISFLLFPISLLYYIGHKVNFNYRKLFQKSYKSKTICVGNIMAGGTGKTPIVIEIVKHIKNCVIVSRGYKGSYTGLVESHMSSQIVGDEPKILSEYAPVFVGKDRNKSIVDIEKIYKISTIVLDDAFQNSSVKYDVKILVFDSKIALGNGFILPAGPLRESLKSGVKQADCIIIIGEKNSRLNDDILKIKSLPIFYATNKLSCDETPEAVVAFAGIGYPDKFFNSLKDTNIQSITTKSFADHHKYSEEELEYLENIANFQNAKLITTEKDWIRLSDKWKTKILKTKLETKIDDKFYIWLKERLKK